MILMRKSLLVKLIRFCYYIPGVQYYALEKEAPILAINAKKGIIYSCPECHHPIRLRSGPHRQPHFYHLARHSQCRQNQKSLLHLQVQNIISSLLPKTEASLEKSFPIIHRIADVAWEKRGMIFEIQCSPISLEEASNRCKDYESIGLQLIWILHDKRFNRRKLSAAEHFLRSRHCYFTNINEKGEGEIYDQEEICKGYKRVFKGAKHSIDLLNPIRLPKKITPVLQKKRFSFVKFYRALLHLFLESI